MLTLYLTIQFIGYKKNIINRIIIILSFYYFYNYYNKCILLGNTSKLYNIQGTNIIKAITIGNNIVQQKDINWSNLILGNEALAHINTKIIIHDLRPNDKPYINPSISGFNNILSLSLLFI